MANIKFLIGIIYLTLNVTSAINNDEQTRIDEKGYVNFMSDLWLEGADIMRILWRECSRKLAETNNSDENKETFHSFTKCIKRKTLTALDRTLNSDVIPISQGLDLVRYDLVDSDGNVIDNQNNETESDWDEQELNEIDWKDLAFERMAKVMQTHVIKVDINKNNESPEKAEFRHRRRNQMLTMMIFGIVSVGMVIIPMAFQFLAVLGGKALILAKMALILSSIQGLKKVDDWQRIDRNKIATSPLTYGFYNTYPHYEHYEKRSHMFSNEPNEELWRNNFRRRKADNPFNTERSRMINKQKLIEPKIYPVYAETSQLTPLLANLPMEVQADYSLDMPINGLHFQSSPSLDRS